MTYDELWDIAYSIGYHHGRHPEVNATRDAYFNLLTRIPDHYRTAAQKRYEQGRKDGAAA